MKWDGGSSVSPGKVVQQRATVGISATAAGGYTFNSWTAAARFLLWQQPIFLGDMNVPIWNGTSP